MRNFPTWPGRHSILGHARRTGRVMNSFRSHPITARPSLIRRSITHPSAMAATAGPSMLPRFPQPVQPCRPGRPWPKLGLAANPSSNTPVVDALPPRARTRPPTAIKWPFSEHGPGAVAAATVPSKTSSRGRLQTHTNGNLVSAQHGIRPSHVSFAPSTIRMSPLFGSPFTPTPHCRLVQAVADVGVVG